MNDLNHELEQPIYYLNRELSALRFIERVLELSSDTHVPLLERMRYLCICSNSLDEFFEIRIAGLKKKLAMQSPKLSIDGLHSDEIFDLLSQKTHELTSILYATFNQQLIPAMKKEHIYFLDSTEWTDDIRLWAKHFFKNEIFPIVSPIALDLAHPLPRFLNKSLNFIIALSGNDAFDRHISYAVVHAPRAIPRMIHLPSELSEDGTYFVHLSTIMKYYIHLLFPGMTVSGCYSFRLTRNSDLSLHDDDIEDLAVALKSELFSRKYGVVVRLEVDKTCPKSITDFLLQKHHLHHEDMYYCDGPLNLQRYLQAINSIDQPALNFPLFTADYPYFLGHLGHHGSILGILDQQDVLLHHPYQSFEVVINLLKEAAHDPKVLAIKQTVYRTPSDAALVTLLVEAARAGKEVVAVIELRARFDEEANLKLANQLQEAGALVLYGVVGYKTHAKMTLIVKRVNNKLKSYVHLGTGNYHEHTAKRYTDLGLLTGNPEITHDVQAIFQQLTGLGKPVKLKAIDYAPFTLHKALLSLIEQCAVTAQKGAAAEIILKANGLSDKSIIQALYKASAAGVKIKLIIRGICCLKPGIEGISDNIKVTSIVGRFLEHHRVYYFRQEDKELFYCASADLLERNLYNRIEIMFPILSPDCQKRIKEEILKNYTKDNTNAWELKADGTYKRLTQRTHDAQKTLIDIHCPLG